MKKIKKNKERPLECILLGAGGHAMVVKALADTKGIPIVGVSDPRFNSVGVSEWQGLRVVSDEYIMSQLNKGEIGLLNGIGHLPHGESRQNIQKNFMNAGFYFPPCIHPSAWVSDDAILEPGCQIMAGAIIQPGCKIGVGSIINTRASIDHECIIGDHVHIAPGAILCGNVTIKDEAFVASGAVVVQNVCVGSGSIIGAGTTLRRDLLDKCIFLGNEKSQ